MNVHKLLVAAREGREEPPVEYYCAWHLSELNMG